MALIINGVTYQSEDIAVTDDVTVGDDIILTSGGTITTTSNGTVKIYPHGTGITQIGDSGSGVTHFYTNTTWLDNIAIKMGSSDDATLFYSIGQTVDTLLLGLGQDSRNLIVCEYDDRGTDFGHAQSSNPTIIVQSADATDTAQNLQLSHNQTDGLVGVGKGGHVTNHGSPVTLADDASFDLPDASAGFGFFMCGDGEEYAQVSWTSAGVVTLINNSANVASTDSDTDFCIFDNGTAVRVRNRLGSSKTVTFDYHYTTP